MIAPAGMTPRGIAASAGLGSALLLAAALAFQAAGYAPCELCILQRWPHLAAALIGALILVAGWSRALAALGLLAALAAAVFAVYHVGVEWQWWAGPTACSGGVGDLAQLTTAELMARLNAAPVVRCDQPAFVFLGLSMAGWNALASAALAAVWAMSFEAPRARPIR